MNALGFIVAEDRVPAARPLPLDNVRPLGRAEHRPGMFASEEMGWLCNEARILGVLAESRLDASGFLVHPERREPAFRKLAAHPRLFRAARELLGSAMTDGETRLWVACRSSYPVDRRVALQTDDGAAQMLAVVFLDDGIWRPAPAEVGSVVVSDPVIQARAGSVFFLPPDAEVRSDDLEAMPPFLVVALHREEGSYHGDVDEYALWPSPYWSAG